MAKCPRLSQGGQFTTSLWDRFATWIDAELRARELQPGTGYTFTNSSGGFSLSVKPSSGPVLASSHPFKCTLFPQTYGDGSPAGNKVGVTIESSLFKSFIPFERYEGDGILNLYDAAATSPVTLDLEGPDETAGYTSPDGVPDDYVFLDIEFDTETNTVASVTATTYGNGSAIDPTLDPWDESGNALVAMDTSTPPKQTNARIVLATYINGNLQQNVSTNLILTDMAINGRLAIYPIPF